MVAAYPGSAIVLIQAAHELVEGVIDKFSQLHTTHRDVIQVVESFVSGSVLSVEASADASGHSIIEAVSSSSVSARRRDVKSTIGPDPLVVENLDQLCRDLPVHVLSQIAPPPPPSAAFRSRVHVRRVGHKQLVNALGCGTFFNSFGYIAMSRCLVDAQQQLRQFKDILSVELAMGSVGHGPGEIAAGPRFTGRN